MLDAPNVFLNLSNQPENVLVVREMLTGMAETVGLQGGDINDIRTAVTEACNNVVLHAYAGGRGPLQVEVFVAADSIEVAVRDHGTGIKPRIRGAEEGALGIGLSIIQALAPHVEFNDVAGGGTEVRMAFATPSALALESVKPDGLQSQSIAEADLTTTTALMVAPGALARKVLPRVVCVLAARAHFSTDRISDAQLVADALVAQASDTSTGERLSVFVSVEPRDLHMRVGPLSSGSSRRMIVDSPLEGLGPVIGKLTDDHEIASDGTSEMLALRLLDRR